MPGSKPNPTRWLWGAVALLCCATVVASVFFLREQSARRQLAAANAEMSADLKQVQGQVQALNARMNALMSAPPAPATPLSVTAADVSPRPRPTHRARRASARHKVRDDPRWNKVESEIAANEQQLQATRQSLETARSDFQNSLNSTRDDLNGSIAKTHDELVALEKRGERNYFEFKLTKSKQFQRFGPLGLALRKTNTKHDFYDMAVLVEDSRLDKKHVSLFEPVWFYPSDSSQPVQLVVNHVSKDRVEGYVSAPKVNETRKTASLAPGANGESSAAFAPEAGASDTHPEPGSNAPAPGSNAPPKPKATLEHRSTPPL